MAEAKTLGAPYELVRVVAAEGKLPVPNFAAGGIATPADAALMRALGAEAVFVGSGIFKSGEPAEARTRDRPRHDPLRRSARSWPRSRAVWERRCEGVEAAKIPTGERLETRGW